MVASTRPETTAVRSRIQEKNRCGLAERQRPDASAFHVVLRDSHMSLETVSRARRAFSRAAPRAPVIELGLTGS